MLGKVLKQFTEAKKYQPLRVLLMYSLWYQHMMWYCTNVYILRHTSPQPHWFNSGSWTFHAWSYFYSTYIERPVMFSRVACSKSHWADHRMVVFLKCCPPTGTQFPLKTLSVQLCIMLSRSSPRPKLRLAPVLVFHTLGSNQNVPALRRTRTSGRAVGRWLGRTAGRPVSRGRRSVEDRLALASLALPCLARAPACLQRNH